MIYLFLWVTVFTVILVLALAFPPAPPVEIKPTDTVGLSKAAPLTSRPTEGVCNVPLIFHIESGRYGDIPLDGLNVALAVHTPGPMGEGNWSVAAYIGERANDKQTQALGAIFTGAAGGPMAAFAPLITENSRGEEGPDHVPS